MECSGFEEVFLNDWTSQLEKKLGDQRYPISGMFELTDRCNLSCVHCYINQSVGCENSRRSELSTDQVKRILDQAAEAGCLFLVFTGGEVFVRQDFLEIFEYARRLGILVTIFTNGTMLNRHIVEKLADLQPRQVEISIYGATAETYEKITKVPGSFDRCVKGIDLLMEKNIPLELKTILLKPNVHEIAEMQQFAEDRGLHFRYDGVLWPRLDNHEIPDDYRLTAEELVAFDQADPVRIKEWTRIYKEFGNRVVRSEFVFNCGAGHRSFHIDSTGKMSICTMVRKPAYDLSEMSFIEAFDKLGELRKLRREKDTKCRTCTLGGLCAQCPGWSQSMYNDFETESDFLCEIAHLREKMIKKSIIIY